MTPKINPIPDVDGDLSILGEPLPLAKADDPAEGIALALELNDRPVFLEGLAERLTQLGTPCTAGDTRVMLAAIRSLYKEQLGKACPRTVLEWVRGTTPGVTSRRNHYELCYALGLDFQQTAAFFRKHFLSLPFNVKSKTDAVFFYCLYHGKPYTAAAEMLDTAKSYVPQENAHTVTAQIMSTIRTMEDDAQFLQYLSSHCYDNEQQFQRARRTIKADIELVKQSILADPECGIVSPDRLGSMTIAALLGYRYQASEKTGQKLPRRFTESLPNDVTIGRILNDATVSYELLRKTLLLLRFYNFYSDGVNTDEATAKVNLRDFYAEANEMLLGCGFAPLYLEHPFDRLLLYAANSLEPIVTLYSVTEYGRN